MIRALYLCAYASLAALGAALVARPAFLWVRSQGLFRTELAWEVPLGAVLLFAGALLALLTLWLASQAALGRKPVMPLHAVFLLTVGTCLALRHAAGDPRPLDSGLALLEGLRTAADELDRGYAGRYSPDAAGFASPLSRSSASPFRRRGRPVRLHARVLSGADGPQLVPLDGDQPGTLYLAISHDRQRAWLTALDLDGILRERPTRPAVIAARAGTHSAPGADEALPAYPGVASTRAR